MAAKSQRTGFRFRRLRWEVADIVIEEDEEGGTLPLSEAYRRASMRRTKWLLEPFAEREFKPFMESEVKEFGDNDDSQIKRELDQAASRISYWLLMADFAEPGNGTLVPMGPRLRRTNDRDAGIYLDWIEALMEFAGLSEIQIGGDPGRNNQQQITRKRAKAKKTIKSTLS